MRIHAFRITAVLVTATMLLATVSAEAEPMRSSNDARHEAFVRGGDAIRDALNQPAVQPRPETSLPVTPDPVPSESAMQDQPEPGKGRSKLLWVGIAIGVAISAYLIQRSVTKHRRIFGPGF